MDAKQLKSDGLAREYVLTVSADDIKSAVNKKLIEVGRTAKVAGFRPGKIPQAMLQQRYEASVLPDVLEKLCEVGVHKIVDDNKFRPALKPKLDVETPYENGKDFICNVSLELLPDVGAVDLTQFSIEQWTAPLDENDVNAYLKNLQTMMGVHTDSIEPLKDGDLVTVGFEGKVNGVPFEGGKHDGMEITVGAGSMIPGFEEQMMGMKTGDKKQITVTFPADYHAASLKGKEATFDLTIVQVKSLTAADLNDELAKRVGRDTLQDLKTAVEKIQLDQIAEMSFLDGKRKILDAMANYFTFDLPKGLVELEFDSIWRQVEREKNSSPQKDGSDTKQSAADIEKEKAEYHALAERRVRLGLVLAEVGKTENVAVSNREIQAEISKQAARYPGHEKKVIDYYVNNPNAVASVRAPLFEDKVIQIILDKANVQKKDVTLDDLKNRVKEITEGDE